MSEPPKLTSERRLAAVWFADIVGYSRFASQDERAALDLVRRFETAAQAVAERYHGRVVKFIGDAALAEFGSTEAAVRAALELRDSFAEIGAEGSHPAALRIGVHIGEVVHREDGDVSGNGVNVAARLQTEAAPGQVLVSEDVWRQLRPLSDFRFEAAGERELRGIDARVAVFGAALAGGADDRVSEGKAHPYGGRSTSRGASRALSRRGLAYIGLACVGVLLAVLAVSARVRTSPVADPSSTADGLAVADPGAVDRSIAVLPFVNMSSDEEQEYFSDGLTEELLNVLAQIPELRVAARTSSFSFKGKNLPVDSVGRALKVGHVLEGSVRKAGDQVRVTAQLIDAKTGFHLWSETYDRELKDVFAVQDEISKAVAAQLRLKLAPGEKLAQQETTDPEAHTLVLKGIAAVRQGTRESLAEAERLYRQAIQRDPRYAQAHARLASVLMQRAYQRHISVEAGYAQARAAAERALALDPKQSEAHTVLGRIADSRDWNFTAAEEHFRRAREANPSDALAHSIRAWLLMRLGKPEEAIREARRATELDPVSFKAYNSLGAMYLYAGQEQRAAEAFQAALALAPDAAPVVGNLAQTQSVMGRHADAIHTAERARSLDPEDHFTLVNLGYAYGRAGKRPQAEQALRALRAKPDASPYDIATVYAALGDKERAFEMLERAVEKRDDYVPDLGVDPAFNDLRGDPRMQRLLQKIGLP